MRYLDPKADLTFKKVFGEYPDLITSFLNALLPFETEDEKIVSLEYLPAELVPETPLEKNSIVDVRCRDSNGRVFIAKCMLQKGFSIDDVCELTNLDKGIVERLI